MAEEVSRRSIFWPVLLILAGALLLLDQMGIVTLNVGALLQLWPLLLVLVGLDLLLRGQRAGAAIQALLALLVVAGALVLARALLTGGGPVETRRLVFPADGVRSANLIINVGVGRVELRAATDVGYVVETTVTHGTGAPEVSLDGEVDGGVANVVIRSKGPGVWIPLGRDAPERCSIGVNPTIPVSLRVNAGVGQADLDLRGLRIAELVVDGGVGEYRVILAESGQYEARIEGGVGAITVILPEEMEARVRVNKGLGSVEVSDRFVPDGRLYVSPGYEEAVHRVDIDIDGGIGTVTVR